MSWSRWWLYNRDRLLSARAIAIALTPASGNGTGNARSEFWRDLATDALLRALRDPHPEPSTGAAIALGKARAATAVTRLTTLLFARGTEASLRESAALALGMIGDESSREALGAIVADRTQKTRLRSFGVFGLGLAGNRDSLPALAAIARRSDEKTDVRGATFLALGLLGDRVATPVLIDAVLDRAARLSVGERALALAALGKLADPDALDVLIAAASDDRAEIRRSAVQAIGRVARPSDQDAHRVLVAAVRADRDALCRAYAAIALGRLGATRGTEPLCELMDAPDASLRGFAAIGLALLVHRNGDEALRERVGSYLRERLARGRQSAEVRGAVVIALGVIGDMPSRSLVAREFEATGTPRLRGHAAIALGLLGARGSLPALREALVREMDPWVQREVALALGLFGDSESVGRLSALVRDGRSEYVRANAALALGRIAGPTASRSMIELLSSPDASGPTRGMAAVALGYLLDRRSVPALSVVAEDLDYMLPLDAIHELLGIL